MNIYMNKFTYEYDEKGTITSAQVGLYGNDKDGEYVSCNLVVKQDDLDEGKTFDDVTVKDVFELTKKKILAYLQPDDTKKVTDTTTTTTDDKPQA